MKGYVGNVCKTEMGIKFLGEGLAKYIIDTLYSVEVAKISFIGHSLGGLIQSFAISSIAVLHPWFFEKVKPVNFITLATPFLGIVTDNPSYVKMLLSAGIIGKTGVDLGLKEHYDNILYLLSGEPIKSIMKKFERRTLYANAMNDGIVPLYTSCLLFLDYADVLSELDNLKRSIKITIDTPESGRESEKIINTSSSWSKVFKHRKDCLLYTSRCV